MPHHGRIGPEFAKLWTESGGQAHVAQIAAIGNRIRTQPGYTSKDFNDLKIETREIVKAQVAGVFYDERTSGSGKQKTQQIWHFGLGIPTTDQDQHYFLGASYTMRPFHFHRAQQFLPLCVVAPHLAKRKISAKHPEQFEYNERFLYVLGASIIIARAIDSGLVNPESQRSVYIPTHNGWYAGTYDAVTVRNVNLSRWLQFDISRARTWKIQARNMQQSDDVPANMVTLLTTIPTEKFFRRDHIICDGLRSILQPAKASGLLRRICQNYVDPVAMPLTESDAQKMAQMVTAMTGLMNGNLWLDAVRHVGLVNPSHAPAERAFRHG